MSGAPEYAAYRDEILFKQTVGRYTAAWHHVKPWYYFIVEVIPALWVPWSLLLFWLVPRFRQRIPRTRCARLAAARLGAAGAAVLFAEPGQARASTFCRRCRRWPSPPCPSSKQVLARRGVRRAGLILAACFFSAAAIFAIAHMPWVRSSPWI